jgi:hypothetical protein
MCTVGAAPVAPSFRFDAKVEVPALGILEATKEKAGMTPKDVISSFGSRRPSSDKAPKRVSSMPVLAPEVGINYTMRVVTPDETIDHKIIVKEPDVAVSP